MSTIVNRGTFGADFIKGLSARLYDIQSQVDLDYSLSTQDALGVQNVDGSGLFKVKQSDQARETITGISQVEDLGLTAEGGNYKSTSQISTYRTEFDFVKYTQSITVTEEMRDDAIVEKELDKARALLVAGKRTINKHLFGLFNEAFTDQASLPAYLTYYGDKVPFCSTLHPIKGLPGQVQSNASATSIPLNEVNLETARQALIEQRGDRSGELLNFGTSNLILLVPPALEKLAVIITNGKLRSNTANNDINIYDGIVTVMSSKRISALAGGSDTAWFLIDSMFSPATFFERRPLSIGSPYITEENRNLTFPVSARYLAGNIDFRGVWASKGDTSDYTA